MPIQSVKDKMYMQRVKIDQYGPLKDLDYNLEPGFNLFFGRNESGKTLLVEAIIRKILGKDEEVFSGISRVNNSPTGEIFFRDEKEDKDIKLSEGRFQQIVPNSTPQDFREAFIIRDFDLRMPREENYENQSKFLQNVSDRIASADLGKIEDIREEIESMGFLTNSTSGSKLSDKQEYGNLETKKENAEELKKDISDSLNDWREEGILEKFSEKKKLDESIDEMREEIKDLEKAEKKENLKKGRKNLEEIKKCNKKLTELGERDDEKEEMEELKREIEEKIDEKEVAGDGYNKVMIPTMILLGLSLIGLFATLWALVPAVILSAFLVYIGIKAIQSTKARKEIENLKERARDKDVEGKMLQTIKDNVEKEIGKNEDERRGLEKKKGELKGELKAIFDKGKGLEIDEWEKFLDEYEEKIDTDIEKSYDENELEDKKKEKQKQSEDLKEIEKEIETVEGKIRDFNNKFQDIPFEKFDIGKINIESIEDLGIAQNRIEEFIRIIEEKVKNAKKAIEILEEVEEEEREQVGKLFEDDWIKEFIEKSTEGNYTDIEYDKVKETLVLTRKDGKRILPNKLSQGTTDLIYMIVRIKLAKELLEDKEGFLILDDAFLHSDKYRIKKEIKFLHELAKEGWQIIYFSFRDDVKESIDDVCDKDMKNIEKVSRLEFE